ncbi:hypothetical protein [Flavobacterium psychrophilum]|uniref:hypothetical protein n=1 Tax=Flavobacterium psychrophilum TaxID=96345 RepID=UPI0009035D57|nr:hypothetical protein [Flavobacterium psychrophilum]EKT4499319.1 hypothetical protein [Flavobacterium psychrophilum]OJH11708.1 hypothetical protein FPG87_08535 [Flavobacterium psychrophilum]SNA77415.1 hypothetical protein DK150_400073 [Flavobacterium psychrophilum]SNA86400.1 hypothetical protein FI146_580047 [Flavobacterium psychrophilum]
MGKVNLNSLFGNELKDLGYKKLKVNYFEKKAKRYLYMIHFEGNRDLTFRLLKINIFNETKCIKLIDIDNWMSLTQFGFLGLVKEIETEFKTLIDEKNE